MRRRSRVLRVAKWGGVVVCGLLLVAYFVGFLRLSAWVSSDGAHYLYTHRGEFVYRWGQPPKYSLGGRRGFWSDPLYETPSPVWWPPVSVTKKFTFIKVLTVHVRIWIILAAIGLPTAFVWRLDRKRRPLPGHCPCGYDLRDNVSGTCPECGVEVRA